MAKEVQVKLQPSSEWLTIEVANFYDPEKHHTVRLPGETKKTQYAAMKMPDGNVYDKINAVYIGSEYVEPEYDSIDISELEDLTQLPFQDNAASEIVLLDELHKREKKDLRKTMNEIYRVLGDRGRAYVTVPYYPNIEVLSDPDCLTIFTNSTFNHFVGDPFRKIHQTITTEQLELILYK